MLALLELLLCVVYLKTVPRFYGDESWEASIGYNIAREGSIRNGAIDGWGGTNVHFLQNQLIQPLFCSISFLIFGYGVIPARLPSVLMAVITVCTTYAIMHKLFTRRAAILCAIMVAVNPWFFIIARRVRPEIFALAFAMLFLMMMLKIGRGKLAWPIIAGICSAIASLSHPNGFVLCGCIFVSVTLWRRPESFFKAVLVMAISFIITVSPYLIYVAAAINNPNVSFAAQMTGGKLREAWSVTYLLQSEFGRWLRYFQWPKGLPLMILYACSLMAAFIKSKPADRIIGTVPIVFALVLPFTTVNTAAVYLSLLSPFFAMLLTRFIQRIWWKTRIKFFDKHSLKNWKVWLAGAIACSYLLICFAGMFVMLRFHCSDIDILTDRIASVTGPRSKVYGNIILQIGADKFNYGYFPLDKNWEVTPKDIFERRYEYAVRLCDDFQTSGGVKPMPDKMPAWRNKNIIDAVCRNFGTKIDTFVIPGYGAAEIYHLDWNKPAATDQNLMTKKFKT